uniref:PDZ domain-containing protein n=1 Tax=Periophthalmus magnuspinnatus TaxID=409849 RepID=A0A3B4BAQ0_9GOBI
MSKTLKKKKHWSTKIQECTVSWGGSGELMTVVEVRGGAELGQFPYVGHVAAEAMACHAGRFPSPGDVLLEVNGTPVSGLTNRDTLAVVRHFREPIRLKTVKPGTCEDKTQDTSPSPHAPVLRSMCTTVDHNHEICECLKYSRPSLVPVLMY